MDNNDRTASSESKRNGGKKWLIPLLLLALVLLALLGWSLSKDSDSTKTNTTSTAPKADTSQQVKKTEREASAEFKFESQFDKQSRTIPFKADAATLDNDAATAAVLGAIAQFYKANAGTKLTVNGSIFEGNKADSASALAKDRAELVKQRLVERGIAAADITVSTVDNYEGKDETARAEYARSVLITAK